MTNNSWNKIENILLIVGYRCQFLCMWTKEIIKNAGFDSKFKSFRTISAIIIQCLLSLFILLIAFRKSIEKNITVFLWGNLWSEFYSYTKHAIVWIA